MNDPLLSALGLARKAGQLSVGHDDVKGALRYKRARVLLFTTDVSPRLIAEMTQLADDLPIRTLPCRMQDMKAAIGKAAGVYTVNNEGLARLVLSSLKEDCVYGTSSNEI